MSLLTKTQIASLLLLAAAATVVAAHTRSGSWVAFWLLLLAVTLSSGFKVSLPRGDGSMSLTFPFILLGILQLSPLQAMLLAGLSIAVQSRVRITKSLNALQMIFNIANAMFATFCALEITGTLQQAGMALAPALAVGSATYFFCNTAAVAMVLASSGAGPLWKVWRAEFPWYLPFYLVGALLAATVHWMSFRFGWSTTLLLIPFVYTLYRAYNSQVSRLLERQQHFEETEALHLRTIEGLAMAIEAKDQGTHDHLFRVRHYVREVGQALQLSKLEMQALETAAFLHDIGKLAVPEHIINKPGKLTPEEFERMKIHPVVGADILERVRFPYPVVPIVRSHHEWWNGKGYPDGLSGDAIPIGARILTVVDCFDALVSDRPYRKGLPSEKAVEMIRDLSGKQFDPQVVQAFEICHTELEKQAEALVPSSFTPLNTEIDVWRGAAPGAGFAADGVSKETVLENLSAVSDSTGSLSAPKVEAMLAAASREAQSIKDLSSRFQDVMLPADVHAQATLRLKRLIRFDTCVLYLRTADRLDQRFVLGSFAHRFGEVPIPLGDGISGWVAQNRRPLLNGNASVEPGTPVTGEGKPAFRSGSAVPLMDTSHHAFAVLTLYSFQEEAFSRADIQVLNAMAEQISLALQASLRLLAAKVTVGGDLPDARQLFPQLEQRLAYSQETQGTFSLVLCGVDRLGDLLKRRGRSACETILHGVAEALQAACRPEELIGRIAEDRFCLQLSGTEQTSVESRLEEIRAALGIALQTSGLGASLPCVTGLACFPEDGSSVEALLSTASRRIHKETFVRGSHREGAASLQTAAGTSR